MMMAAAMTTGTKIAELLGLTENELCQQALLSLLYEKKREVLQQRLNILARYGAGSLEDLESKIAEGAMAEHPAWEDMIVVENLSARVEELDDAISTLE